MLYANWLDSLLDYPQIFLDQKTIAYKKTLKLTKM